MKAKIIIFKLGYIYNMRLLQVNPVIYKGMILMPGFINYTGKIKLEQENGL